MLIRGLDPIHDHGLVKEMYLSAKDYWRLDRQTVDVAALTDDYFTDAPPNCDPAASHRLGLFLGPRLAGIAELSFGFPEATDAYLGLMIFADWARGQGFGTALLAEIQSRARAQGCKQLFLAVLDNNPKGRAFWLREGFADTGKSRIDSDHGVTNTIRRLGKTL